MSIRDHRSMNFRIIIRTNLGQDLDPRLEHAAGTLVVGIARALAPNHPRALTIHRRSIQLEVETLPEKARLEQLQAIGDAFAVATARAFGSEHDGEFEPRVQVEPLTEHGTHVLVTQT